MKHPNAGGAEVFVHQIAKRLVERGHEVSLFTSSFNNSLPREEIDGITHVRYGGRFSIYALAPLCYSRHVKGRFDAIVESINGMPFFTPLFAKEKVFSLVHQLTGPNWYSGLPAPIAFFGFHAEKPLLSLYKHTPCIVPSGSTMDDMKQLGFNRLRIVYGAAEVSPPKSKKSSAPALLYLGRLTRSKRVDHALLAFRRIIDEMPDARLWVAGSGPDEHRLRALVAQSGLSPWVTFFGHVNEEQKVRLLSSSHLMLFPAVREGWGLTVLEANACGTPVIGYDVPGLRDSIRDGVNGFLAKDGDSGNMADKALRLLKSTNTLRKISRSAKSYSSQFSWDSSAKEFESILEREVG